jgi:hypothetical protein
MAPSTGHVEGDQSRGTRMSGFAAKPYGRKKAIVSEVMLIAIRPVYSRGKSAYHPRSNVFECGGSAIFLPFDPS